MIFLDFKPSDFSDTKKCAQVFTAFLDWTKENEVNHFSPSTLYVWLKRKKLEVPVKTKALFRKMFKRQVEKGLFEKHLVKYPNSQKEIYTWAGIEIKFNSSFTSSKIALARERKKKLDEDKAALRACSNL